MGGEEKRKLKAKKRQLQGNDDDKKELIIWRKIEFYRVIRELELRRCEF